MSNPLSRRNRTLQQKIEATLAAVDDVIYERLTGFGSLNRVLRRFADQGVELLVINGGDGTVSAVMTEIFEHKMFSRIPLFAILPGGTSNTIAADVGLRGNPIGSLRRLMAAVEKGLEPDKFETRAVIRIEYDRNRTPVCGFFFGTAGICDATMLRRRLFPQRWLPDALAAAMTLVYVLGVTALGRTGVLPAQPIGVDLDGEVTARRAYTVLLVSTLNRILLGSSPFWGKGGGGLRFTSIASPARGLLRYAYKLLYGRDRSTLPGTTYASAAVDRIVLHMDCPFALDGEFYEPAKGGDVSLSCPFSAKFLQC